VRDLAASARASRIIFCAHSGSEEMSRSPVLWPSWAVFCGPVWPVSAPVSVDWGAWLAGAPSPVPPLVPLSPAPPLVPLSPDPS